MLSFFEGNQSRLKSLIGDATPEVPSQEEEVQKQLSKYLHYFLDPELCRTAGLPQEKAERLGRGMVLGVVVIFVLVLLTLSPSVLLIIPVIPLAVRMWLRSKSSKRAESFDKDFAALLLSIASSLRAGVDATSALERSVHLFPKESVMSEELGKFVRNIASGKTEDDSMAAFGEDIDHPDIELFRRSFLLSRRQGGSLSMCLQRLARFTRQRQSFRRKIKAALAMQKLSSFGIAGCAILIVLMQAVSQTESFFDALKHPLGFRMLSIGGILILVGIGGMIRLSTYKGSESS